MRILGLLIFTAVLSCNAGIANAQIWVERLSLNDPRKPELYHYVPNRLRVAGLESADSVAFASSWILSRNRDLISIKTARMVSQDTLTVYRKGMLIYRDIYGIKSIPELAVYLGAIRLKTSGRIRVDDLIHAGPLLVKTGNFRSGIVITSFELSVKTAPEYIELGNATGNAFSTTQRRLLEKLQPGDRVYFEDIKANIDGRTRQLSSFSLLIEE